MKQYYKSRKKFHSNIAIKSMPSNIGLVLELVFISEKKYQGESIMQVIKLNVINIANLENELFTYKFWQLNKSIYPYQFFYD